MFETTARRDLHHAFWEFENTAAVPRVVTTAMIVIRASVSTHAAGTDISKFVAQSITFSGRRSMGPRVSHDDAKSRDALVRHVHLWQRS